MMENVGYLYTKFGSPGEVGTFYDYILAGNGLFVRAKSPLIEATICIAEAEVRGLKSLDEKLTLSHGLIPRRLYDLAYDTLLADWSHERYLAITWHGDYHIVYPPQKGNEAGVEYERVPDTVLDIHSHDSMKAFFSGTDDRDEQGLRLFMVMGKLDTMEPEYSMRVGVYGYFAPVAFEEVFG